MGFDDSIDKKKTETDAGCAAAQTAIHPVIPVKYPGQICGRNADPLVRHIEHQPSGSVLILRILLPAANPDAAAVRRIFNCIAEQIRENLAQALFIPMNDRQIEGQIQLNRVRLGLRAVVLRHSLKQPAHVYVGALQPQAAGLNTADVQQIVDQRLQPVRFLLDYLQTLPGRLGIPGRGPVGQGFAHSL